MTVEEASCAAAFLAAGSFARSCLELAPDDRSELFGGLSDIAILEREAASPGDPKDISYHSIVNCEALDLTDPQSAWAAFALLYGLRGYLDEGLGPADPPCQIARLFASWQAYGIARRLAAPDAHGPLERGALEALAASFGRLRADLLDRRLRYGVRELWRRSLIRQPRPRWSVVPAEKLLISLPLVDGPSEAMDTSAVRPLPAPGCFVPKRGANRERPRVSDAAPIDWETSRAHPAFTSAGARESVRRAVDAPLLHNYNLADAARLGTILHGHRGQFAELWPCLVALPSFVALIVVGLHVLNREWADTAVLPMLALFVVTGVSFALVALFVLGRRGFVDLSLTRLSAGIAMGYLPLMLDSAPWDIAASFNTPGLGCVRFRLLLVWLAAIAVASSYLMSEAQAVLGDQYEALKRSTIILLVAVAITIAIGLLMATVTDAVRGSTDAALSVVQVAGLSFSLAAVFFFAPLALLIGIATQFLWEREPVTAALSLGVEGHSGT